MLCDSGRGRVPVEFYEKPDQLIFDGTDLGIYDQHHTITWSAGNEWKKIGI